MTAAHFRNRYAIAFARFIRERSERSLRAAYELGRDAVQAQLSVLEIAAAHNDSLAHEVVGAAGEDIPVICTAAGDFLIESLAAFEMVQRGSSDARRAAFIERRNARMLRQLSALLADQSLAAGDGDSLAEVLQVAAENVREMTDARCASVHVVAGARVRQTIDVRSESDGSDTWSDVVQPPTQEPAANEGGHDALRVPLLALGGSTLGELTVERKVGGPFSAADEALATHVAQMTAAAVERALAYG